MKKLALAVAVVSSGLVFAQDSAKLACPAGTKQVGGLNTPLEANVCVKIGKGSSREFHGPYVAFWKNGAKQSEGQFKDGFRDGKWSFYDDKGVKTGETNFSGDDYNGARIEYHANGNKKLVENYVKGSRQGVQSTFDEAGKVMTTVNFVNDRPVASNQ